MAWLHLLLRQYVTSWGYVVDGGMRYSGDSDSDEGVIRVAKTAVTSENTVTYW